MNPYRGATSLDRYSLGTKNQDLVYGDGGSLTLYAQHEPRADDVLADWLPAPEGDFSLYLRAYCPPTPSPAEPGPHPPSSASLP